MTHPQGVLDVVDDNFKKIFKEQNVKWDFGYFLALKMREIYDDNKSFIQFKVIHTEILFNLIL